MRYLLLLFLIFPCDASSQSLEETFVSFSTAVQNRNHEEVINKTKSLKGILEPFSTNGNIEMLQRSGFKDITTVIKDICFEGFLAIK